MWYFWATAHEQSNWAYVTLSSNEILKLQPAAGLFWHISKTWGPGSDPGTVSVKFRYSNSVCVWDFGDYFPKTCIFSLTGDSELSLWLSGLWRFPAFAPQTPGRLLSYKMCKIMNIWLDKPRNIQQITMLITCDIAWSKHFQSCLEQDWQNPEKKVWRPQKMATDLLLFKNRKCWIIDKRNERLHVFTLSSHLSSKRHLRGVEWISHSNSHSFHIHFSAHIIWSHLQR